MCRSNCWSLVAVMLALVISTEATTTRPTIQYCSVDVTFVIDNSGSIRDTNTGGVDNWALVLQFIQAIVNRLDVAPNATRVAVVDFGNAARLDFNLENYTNKYDVINAIGRIGYHADNTNLTGGLKVARTQVYEAAIYSRQDVDRAIVVITDGVPTKDVDKLGDEVERIKRMGIRIMALGVTNKVNTSLLQWMVNSPPSQNYFYVTDFSFLDRVAERLSVRACNRTILPDPVPTATPETPVCGRPLDLTLVIDGSGSINWDGWYSAIDMAKRLVQRLPVGVNQTRVAVVVFGVGAVYEIRFSDYRTSTDIVNAIGRLRYYGGHTDLNSALTLLWKNVFVSGSTRVDALKAAIVISDGEDTESSDAVLGDSAALCGEHGIQLFAIGITYRFKRDRLLNIVSRPSFFYEQTQFQGLSDYLYTLTHSSELDPGCRSPDVPVAIPECVAKGTPIDLVFLFDSSESIGSYGWNLMKNFSFGVLDGLDVGPAATQVATVVFECTSSVAFGLQRFGNKPDVENAIRNVAYKPGGTNLNGALYLLWSNVFGAGNGARSAAARVAIVLTDGEDVVDAELTMSNATSCRSSGIHVITVGIGSAVRIQRLADIASSPRDFFPVSGFGQLSSIVDDVSQRIECPPTTTGSSTTIVP